MQRWFWSIAAGVLVLGAGLSCGRQRAPGGGDTVGTVSLPLQATAPSGNVYQLRNATFRLTGPTTTMLTTAGTPDAAAALMATLQVGGYTAELLPGWTLFRVDAGGVAQAVDAQIVSANPTSFTVASQLQTTVGFAFDTAGTVVDTSQGTASIIITVTERDAAAGDAGPMCSPVGGPCGRTGGVCCAGAICPPAGGNDLCIACRQPEQSCAATSDCCSGTCVAGRCTDAICSPIGGPCGRTGGVCCAGATCPPAGGNDLCIACRQPEQSCGATSDCCSGTCVAGRCTNATCSPVGGPCGRTGGVCCAGAICPPAGGNDLCIACRQPEQSCGATSDCCSGTCVAGRCTNATCSPVGGPCGRTGGVCCAGAICPPIGGNDLCIACRQPEQSCSATSDCCSGTCVAGRCTNATCSPVGGPCGRTGGVCCADGFCPPLGNELCVACRRPEQSCAQSSDCCSGSSCTGGRCVMTTRTPPAFGAAGAGVEGTGDLSVPYPAGIAAGQLLILQIGSRAANVPVTPAGWTLLAFDQHMNGRQRLYWRTATGTESGALAVATGTSEVNVGRMYSFSGVSNPFTAEASTVVTDDDGSPAGPTVATAGTGRLAVLFAALDSNPAMAAFTGEIGGDWNEPVAEFGSGLGANFSLQLQIAPMPSGGTISGGSANFGGSSDGSICRAFALIGL